MIKISVGLCLAFLYIGTPFQANAISAINNCQSLKLTTCPKPIDEKLPDTKDMLNWNQQQRVIGFRNNYRSYMGDVFKASKAVPIPLAKRDLSAVSYYYYGKKLNLINYLKRNNVTGMMVIKNGKIVWDYYGNGNTPTTLWTSRSVAKSVVSTLIGLLVKEGKILSLDDEIARYNPDVHGTAWEHVTIRQLLQHTSGVTWNEDYTNPKSDFSLLTQCEANNNTYNCVNKLVKNPNRKVYAKPGTVWAYSSGGAWLLGDTLEKLTGKSLAKNLEEKIWQPYGMNHDGVWHSYQKGKHDAGAHGFNATLEDWGKFGLYVMDNGQLLDGTKTLPDNWLTDVRRWTQADNSVTITHPDGSYGYQWWNNSVPKNLVNVAPKHDLESKDTIWALGIFGQIIMVNQKEKLVIVQWSVWPKAVPPSNAEPLEASLMFNSIANYLRNK